MEFSLRLSGNVWIAKGSSVAGFGETEAEAVRRWESMYQADQKMYSGRERLPKKVLQDGHYKGLGQVYLQGKRKYLPEVWKGFRTDKQLLQKEGSSGTTEEVVTAAVA